MVSLNDVAPGSSADSSCLQQCIDALKGTAGKGVPISITAVNDSVNFGLDVRNQDTVNGRSFRVRDSSNSVQIQADVNGVTINQPIMSSGTFTGSTFTGGSVKNSSISGSTIATSVMSLLAASSNVVQVPQVRLTHTSTQTISGAGALVALTFNTEAWDNDGCHSTTTNPTRITPSRAGLWSLGGSVLLDANSSGYTAAILRLNGATTILTLQVPNHAAGNVMPIAVDYQLSTSDYVELCAAQNSGGNLAASSVAAYTNFWATYRGAT